MNSIEYWDNYLEELASRQMEVNQKLSRIYDQALEYGIDMEQKGFETRHMDEQLKRQLQDTYGIDIDLSVPHPPQEKTFSHWVMRTRAVRV